MDLKYLFLFVIVGGVMFVAGSFAANVVNVIRSDASGSTHQASAGQTSQCPGFDAVGSKRTPPEISEAVRLCAVAGETEVAADLFLLMLSRAHFDIQRVTDRTAHSAIGALSQVTWERVGADGEAVQDILNRRGEHDETSEMAICDRLRELGPSEHDPAYLVNHGMNALTGDGSQPLRAEFDASAAWEATLVDYLNCLPA